MMNLKKPKSSLDKSIETDSKTQMTFEWSSDSSSLLLEFNIYKAFYHYHLL